MRALLGAHDVWEIMDDGYEEPANEESLSQQQRDRLRDSRKRDKKALCLIYQSLRDDDFEKISNATTTKEAWEKFQVSCKGAEQVKKVKMKVHATVVVNMGEVVAKDQIEAEDMDVDEELHFDPIPVVIITLVSSNKQCSPASSLPRCCRSIATTTAREP
ncbi:Unknown protein [Striga hermonthica]|uniref:Uncharacterized protein n=1 Tax=Striga hermonthica TaxID=68872 RepID=A0A9N7MSD8_STRHE|nr:Unknown protein [Striga hermonthica]